MRESEWVILFVLMVTTLHSPVEGKILTQCEAARELERAKISKSLISNWVCLMQSESGMNTALVTGPKTASSYSYGILQINSVKWCTRGRTGGICNKRCEDFLNDNIQESIACAKKIFDREGFKAWDGWTKKCKNKPLPNVSNCTRKKRMVTEIETAEIETDSIV
ncbi:lysozyme-like [Pogonomyrmex barbatus]|uniref:lysozyme n=1 Tax=Pogonomyrmex barbatus TaxID=144034 RepID=A0A6I9X1S8_9HYME|nr:lysozyme-like [Pogonomyrmex barbatus]